MKYLNLLPLLIASTIFFSQAHAQSEETSAAEATKSGAETPPASVPTADTPVSTPPQKGMPTALPPERSDTLTPEQQAIRDAININWYQPQGFPDTEKKIVRITVAGQAKQGTRIYLKSNEIKVLKSATETTTRKLSKDDVKFLPSLADQRGIFAFEMNLPPGNYQIGVSAVDPEAQSMNAAKVYILFLNVTYKKVDFGFVEDGGEPPYTPASDYYSFGLGFNYAIFNKEVPSVPSEIRFSSFKFPSLRLGYAKTWNPQWRIHASLLAAPGETTAGTRIPVEKGTYLWTILSVDGIYSRDTWKFDWGSYKARYAIRGGLQVHSVPFIQSASAADNTQEVTNVSYMSPVVGGQLDLMTDYGLSYEVYMRLGIPFIAQSSLAMQDSLLFDGSLGARYRTKSSKWSYGVYWYGQWLKYKFKETDKFINGEVSGSSDILNSNIEFRLHYHY
ncbi:MAG TPA: hypothetical protein VGE46_02160 [Bdellovibrio sp.]